jgi:hypothetical protein
VRVGASSKPALEFDDDVTRIRPSPLARTLDTAERARRLGLMLLVLLAACSSSQVHVQALTAATASDLFNHAEPLVLQEYRRGGEAAVLSSCADASPCSRATATVALEAYEARWRPVRGAMEGVRSAHDQWRRELTRCQDLPDGDPSCAVSLGTLESAFISQVPGFRCVLRTIGRPDLDPFSGPVDCTVTP